MATNVPSPTFGARGFEIPAESVILSGVLADMNAAFGGNLNPSLSTPQGQIASSNTAIIGNANETFLLYTNMVDPAYAFGRMQDAIGRIYFISRIPAQPTIVQALCVGLAGTEIPAGSLASASDGNIYTCTEGGFIGVDGTVTLPFACNIMGPTPCPPASLTNIYRAIPGWNSITNIADGVLGNEVESRADFEARRAASVAQNSRGSIPSVLGAVLNVDGVLDAYVTENVSASPVTIGGAVLAGKSLYVTAVGGTKEAVANAIWSKKAPGCGYNGNTTVTVYDSNSGYVPPYPEYQVSFEIPASLPILFSVVLADNPQVPSNAVQLIQTAIIQAFAGADGGTRARIGTTVYASRYYAPVAALGSWAQIVSIDIGSANASAAQFVGSIAGNTLTVTSVTSGTVAIGMTLSKADGSILPGTVITAGSGSTWTVSVANTVASGAIFGARADANSVTVNINQVPTISADNITVRLI